MIFHPDMTAKEVEEAIQAEYLRGRYGLGWSYIYGPLRSRIEPEVVTIGLNPGGGKTDADWATDAHFSQDHEAANLNSYFHQNWNGSKPTKLQLQIRYLRNTYFPKTREDRILSFNLVPFRSSRWADYPSEQRARSLDFGVSLLDWTLAKIGRPKLIMGFGLFPVIESMLGKWHSGEIERIYSGWGGRKRPQYVRAYNSAIAERFIVVPHLSTFSIFGRSQFLEERRAIRG